MIGRSVYAIDAIRLTTHKIQHMLKYLGPLVLRIDPAKVTYVQRRERFVIK